MSPAAWFFAGMTAALILVWPRTRELFRMEWFKPNEARWHIGFDPAIRGFPFRIWLGQLYISLPWLRDSI